MPLSRPGHGCTWTARSGSGRARAHGGAGSCACARARSWATDAHKWLNVPYDCGIAIVADREAHRQAMAVEASYLQQGALGATWTGTRSSRAGRGRCRSTRRCARWVAAAWPSWWTGSARAPSASPSGSAPSQDWRCSPRGSTRCSTPRPGRRHRPARRPDPARRHVLDQRHHLARRAVHARLGVQLADHVRRRGPLGRRDRARSRRWRPTGPPRPTH